MNESLTNRQIAFIIFGIVVGYGVLGLPKNVTENAGTGGWFTLLMATAITIIFTYIITYLGYVHKNKTIYEYSNILTGKFIASIFMIIYIIYYFMLFTMIIRMASEAIKLTVLIKTPVWALCLLFLSVVYYAVIKKLEVIARICEIYGLILIIGYITIHLAVLSQGKLINLRPFFVAGDLQAYLNATLVTIFPFLGVEILTIISFNKKKNNKRVFKYTTLMVGFIGILYILIVESCISIMGVDGIVHYKDALFATIRRVDIKSLQFLERIDGIFLTIWIMGMFCTASIEAYGSVFLMSKWFKDIHFNLLAFIVIILAFIVGQIPKTIDDVEKIMDYISYCTLITAGFIPMILFLITKVKKYDKKIR
ncbi:GerAB/ArcD/ProY family transporter [Tepidibacter hydrothermalis]|uniref:GerAB/ArcD/ProY family transporter n=1 Tax=Tepidibacter hydrothermalis TaxID=3036126 RepID=A0ABY8EEE0_9FIRM|nr:GerAB/ArcD/ProY family transporter [Tepidibacter hydrothermalis]WFD09195.1 GerAB/ArcD/ProY family transporter [Tepidibacter hydrothermalis]